MAWLVSEYFSVKNVANESMRMVPWTKTGKAAIFIPLRGLFFDIAMFENIEKAIKTPQGKKPNMNKIGLTKILELDRGSGKDSNSSQAGRREKTSKNLARATDGNAERIFKNKTSFRPFFRKRQEFLF